MIRYKGLCYPVKKHPKGLLHNTDDISQIEGNLAIIVLTHPGERVMEPTFGTDLINVELNQPKKIVASEFKQRVARSIKRWEKRIQIKDIKIDFDIINDEKLVIKIGISFINPFTLKDVHELNIEKYIGGIYGRGMPF